MKATIKNLFSITITEEQYFQTIKPKFEIVHALLQKIVVKKSFLL